VVQDSIMKIVRKLPEIIQKTKFATASVIDPNDFASYISGLVQTDLGFKKSSFLRSYGKRKERPETDYLRDKVFTSDDDQTYVGKGGIIDKVPARPDSDEEDKPKASSLKHMWWRGVELVGKVKGFMIGKIKEIQSGKTRLKTTRLEGQAKLLDTTLAIMRYLPTQMAQQLDLDSEDQTSGDDKIYAKLKSMIADPESDMDVADRGLMQPWAKEKGGNDHIHRQIIATALWIVSGMKPEMQPRKALDSAHWFYDYAKSVG
jgi:hypothetical protein